MTSNAVQWDEKLDEPYIDIVAVPGIRLTPLRDGDEASIAKLQREPMIAARMYTIPSDDFVKKNMSEVRETIEALKFALKDPETPHTFAFGYPFQSIRNSDGEVIGLLSLRPFEHDPRGISKEQMLALPRKEQTWIVGYKLHPAYQGKGIMSSSLKTAIDEWIKPWMGVGQLTAGIELDNLASLALAERVGFRRELVIDIPWTTGGTRKLAHYLKDL
ncbi:acyl-CoA N-acyltransferase [Naematelia encephala]|uniref:Acyl-CoA N-acyltransferase n=1 Tax=Naematelia encephala TaxID=71784 RepID=A0A1Y2BB85_9TREE|nr:acyl-CoA N-acyltransferase [Naematelia encephala]